MADYIIDFVNLSLSWLPSSFFSIFVALIGIKFADSILGVINRAWKVVGRG